MSRPLNFVASQAMHFFRPIISVILDGPSIGEFASFLEQRGSIEYLCQRLEHWNQVGPDFEGERCPRPRPTTTDHLMNQIDPEQIKVILATDCGSTTTKAILIQYVDGEYRQTYRGEAPTTVEKPFADVTMGVVNSVTEIEELADRRLVDDQGRIISRQPIPKGATSTSPRRQPAVACR